MNLYEMLGVARTATKEEIRKAFRKGAKRLHPDSGGSTEAFTELQTAHNILTDDAARDHYDRTGEIEATPIDPDEMPRKMFATLLIEIIGELGKQARHTNIVNRMHHRLATEITKAEKIAIEVKADKDLYVSISERVSVAEDQDNLISGIINTHAGQFDRQLKSIEETVANFERVLEILEDYEDHPEMVETQIGDVTFYPLLNLKGLHNDL